MTTVIIDLSMSLDGFVTGPDDSRQPARHGRAALATMSASRTGSLQAHGTSAAAALTGGYLLAFWIAAGLVVAAPGGGRARRTTNKD
jgi:hypothetical protein